MEDAMEGGRDGLHAGSGASSPGRLRPWHSPLPWLTRGDLDGLATMVSQNLATMLIGAQLLHVTLEKGSSTANADRIVYGQVLPGMGLAMCFGCCFYAIQAQVKAASSNRCDLCSQPFGISTPGVFVFVASIVTPVFQATQDVEKTMRVACLANLIQGLVEILCSFLGPYAVHFVSVGALLTALANIGFSFLLIQPLQSLASAPVVALAPVVLLLLAQLAEVRLPKLPTAAAPLAVATLLAWSTAHLTWPGVSASAANLGAHPPGFGLAGAFEHLGDAAQYIGIILPVALTASIGTLQCQQLAETAGDSYSVRGSMLGDGLATCLAALCGCPFGFTVYIGHPALKQMGCAVGYNILVGVTVLLVCCSGAAAVILQIIPVEGLNSFVIFVGIVVCADALKVMPSRHWPAFVVGLIPGVCNWATTQASNFALGLLSKQQLAPPDFTLPQTWSTRPELEGLFALGNGYILSAMCLCSIVMSLIDRAFLRAAVWCWVSALLSVVGFIHSPSVFLPWQRSLNSPSWLFAWSYASCGVLFLGLRGAQCYGYVSLGSHDGERGQSENGLFASIVDQRYEEKPAAWASSFRRSYP